MIPDSKFLIPNPDKPEPKSWIFRKYAFDPYSMLHPEEREKYRAQNTFNFKT
jgi:hypothetical protein